MALLVLFTGMPLAAPLIGHASALTGADFSAGHIIDDVLFTNNSSMSAQDVQNFLNAKVPSCDTYGTKTSSHYNSSAGRYYTRAEWGTLTGNSAPFTCLRDYVENPTTKQNNYSSPTVAVPGGISAAQIIWNAGQTYQINPQVILTTLQKEQGLVTDDWPWTSEYQAAMGYGCPDTAACSTKYYGFYNQVDNAAWQYRYDLDHSGSRNFIPGQNNYIGYYPCANGTTVFIQNPATAVLYNYTPYQPDPTVLSNTNPTGSANGAGAAPISDNCATYGNRNFWWYYNSWFGASLTSAYNWQPTSQYAYTDSSKTTPIGLTNLAPGQRVYIGFTVKNMGNATWSNTGPNPIDAGTLRPTDRSSPFTDPTWLGPNRPARMKEASVAPGQTATFEFWITAPYSSLNGFNEYFGLLSENSLWLPDQGMYYGMSVQTPNYAWQLTSQYAYTDSSKTVSTGLANLQPSQRAYVGLTAKNTGNTTWVNSGLNPLNLGTSNSYDRSSLFTDPTWLSPGRPTRMKEASVTPGQTATFEFWVTAPTHSYGNFNEYFDPLIEGRTWLNNIGFNYSASVITPSYSWRLTSQYAYSDSSKSSPVGLENMSKGQTAFVGLTAVNTSNVTWFNNGNNPVDLGTTHAQDRNSVFYTSGWPGYNRPTRMKEASVTPGQIATFEFVITAPNTAGTYREYINPLIEGISWLPDIGLNYYIVVK